MTIDKIFVISLPSRDDRRALLIDEFMKYNIQYEIWEATSHENGVQGLLLSMKALFEYCLMEGYKNVLILEDDCSFHVEPHRFLSAALPQLPADYHCLYLGLNLLSPPVRFSENILKIGTAYSTHAIVYSKEAMSIMLAELNKGEIVPYDIMMMRSIQQQGKCYCTYPMIATQRPSYSDIDRTERDWGVLMNMTFNHHTKNLQIMEQETIPCKNEHLWGGRRMVDLLNSQIFQPQHTELWGVACDCKKLKILGENMSGCACDNSQRWEFQISGNP